MSLTSIPSDSSTSAVGKSPASELAGAASSEGVPPPVKAEVFGDSLTKELAFPGGLKWTVWEQYEAAPGSYPNKKNLSVWSAWQKVAWFSDIITFWQLWNTLPVAHLEKYFFDKDKQAVPVYQVGSDQKRISTLSVFQTGVEPNWEDPTNATGSEFRFTITPTGEKSLYDPFLNKLWEDFVVDLVSGRMPHTEEIAGIRIADKSRGEQMIRLEVWMKFENADSDPKGDAIKNFVFAQYLKKYDLPTSEILKFENHRKH